MSGNKPAQNRRSTGINEADKNSKTSNAPGKTVKAGEPLTKGPKRTHSDVSEASAEEMTIIHQQLDGLSKDIKETKESIQNLMSKKDTEEFIKQTVNSVVDKMYDKFTKLIDRKVKQEAKELEERIKGLEFENRGLKDRLLAVEEHSEILKQKLSESEKLAQIAAQRSNFNEQYSRKNNLKILDVPEKQTETEASLTEAITSLLLSKGNVDLDPSEIVAIHRIPGKPGHSKPILLKLKNNSVKVKVMRQRSLMKTAGHRMVDDVTKMNTGLISRLLLHERIESAWYFNGAVYGRTREGKRLKFDIYCNIDETINRQNNSNSQGY